MLAKYSIIKDRKCLYDVCFLIEIILCVNELNLKLQEKLICDITRLL